MKYEIDFEAVKKTYATREGVRKAIAKTGDDKRRHIIYTNAQGRFLPVFLVDDTIMATTGIHFRWPVA